MSFDWDGEDYWPLMDKAEARLGVTTLKERMALQMLAYQTAERATNYARAEVGLSPLPPAPDVWEIMYAHPGIDTEHVYSAPKLNIANLGRLIAVAQSQAVCVIAVGNHE